MARKEPREVAGLGRPETPEETRERVSRARAERRARQTIRNLVWSMLASLGVVAVLVLVVARPDSNLVETINWSEVAQEAAGQLPDAPVSPVLVEGWTANRAEVSSAPGADAVWSIGLLSPDGAFVFLDQGFSADIRWVAERTRQARSTGTLTITTESGDALVWEEYDRRDTDPNGNYAYLLVTELDSSYVVLGGTSELAVLDVARAVSEFLWQAKRDG